MACNLNSCILMLLGVCLVWVFLSLMVIATQYSSVYTLEISHTIPIGLDLALDVRCDPEIEMLTLKIMCNKKQPRIECHVDLQGWLPKGKNTCS